MKYDRLGGEWLMEMTETDRAEGLLRSRPPRDEYQRRLRFGATPVRSGVGRGGLGGVRGTRSLSRHINNCVRLTKEFVRPREGSQGGHGHPADKTHKEDKKNDVTNILPTTVNIAFVSTAPPRPKASQIAT